MQHPSRETRTSRVTDLIRSFCELFADGSSKDTVPDIVEPVQKNGVLAPLTANEFTLSPMVFPECF